MRSPTVTRGSLKTILEHVAWHNDALNNERTKLKKGKPLPLVQRKETQARTQWWPPRALESARKPQDKFNKGERNKELLNNNKASVPRV
jgi:hypothetical protein